MGTLCLKEVKRVEIKEHVVDAYDRLISMGWEPFEELKVPTLPTVKRLRKLKAEYAN
jgi:hypothetical protein